MSLLRSVKLPPLFWASTWIVFVAYNVHICMGMFSSLEEDLIALKASVDISSDEFTNFETLITVADTLIIRARGTRQILDSIRSNLATKGKNKDLRVNIFLYRKRMLQAAFFAFTRVILRLPTMILYRTLGTH